mmetsp:Transcript_26121/g.72003  ORF Transcript_26121/g.72003 Transcript_26121/m.72003 type:complete len:301 (+) Transcript_26121:62-964(+)
MQGMGGINRLALSILPCLEAKLLNQLRSSIAPSSLCSHYSKSLLLRRMSTMPEDATPLPATGSDNSAPLQGASKRAKIESDDSTLVEKKVVRKEIRAKLKALSKEKIQEQSHRVWSKLVGMPEYKDAKSVGLFLSMPKSEISTAEILGHCVADGKDIYVPQVGQNFENADMELLKVFHESGDATNVEDKEKTLFYESWPKNKWSIPEPPSSMEIQLAKPGDIDLLIVPGLAFDRNGNRLGQGRGYYDRFIERMEGTMKLVAVCMDCQLLDEGRSIPVNHYDQRMDKILSPGETIISAAQK